LPMRAITLGYHDVVENLSDLQDTRRRAPAHYALSRVAFREHLAAIRKRTSVSAVKTIDDDSSRNTPVFVTFDDGASGAYTCIADELENMGWRGHFFIISSWIGEPGFMNGREIRELRHRGHVIGSHSHTHPSRISHLDDAALAMEWSESCKILADVLDEPVTCASVPNGFSSARVIEAATLAGIEILFNSEPTAAVETRQRCHVFGRYAVTTQTTAANAAAMAAGEWGPRWRQAAAWQLKKTAKAIGGEAYLKLRSAVLAQTRA
jgi:peptidoglycan/xylan/chitin deacetylase (PgdA/CDA1 family)